MAAITDDQRAELRRSFAADHMRVIDAMEARERREARKAKTVETPSGEFTIDLSNITDSLTVGDAADIEDATDVSVGQLGEALGRGSMKVMAAIVWVLRRKEDAKFTLKDARDLTLGELMAILPAVPAEDGDDPLGDDSALPSA